MLLVGKFHIIVMNRGTTLMHKALLLKQIEQCRKEMIDLSKDHGMTADVVVHSSKKLDDLLNQYDKNPEMITN